MSKKTFKNLNELAKYLKNNQKVLKQVIDKSNIKEMLNSEAQRLQRYLIEEMNLHLTTFTPEYYQRKGAWLESVKINPVQQVGNTFTISISFDDEFAYHPSVMPNGSDVNVAWVFEIGYKDRSYKTPNFKGFEGLHYISKAITRWNQTNKLGLSISVYYGDKKYI